MIEPPPPKVSVLAGTHSRIQTGTVKERPINEHVSDRHTEIAKDGQMRALQKAEIAKCEVDCEVPPPL
jgi:hypothetical protein